MPIVFQATVAWTAASLLLPPLIALSWRIGALDVPKDRRRMHRDSVPRIGGVAIFFAFLFAVLLRGDGAGLKYTLTGAALVFAVGLADDLFTLPAWIKLFFQLVAAAFAVGGEGTVRGAWTFAAVFWIILLTNAHNLIDGLDGLFAGAAILESVGLAAILAAIGRPVGAPLCLAAACLAFRAKNRAPASVFAGDCGSGTVGFLLGMLSLPAFGGEWSLGWLAPVLIFAYPVTDLIAAVLRRVLRGKPLFEADRGHLHHRLSATGLGAVAVGRVLLAACAAFVAVGVFLAREKWAWIAAIVCLAAIGILLVLRHYVLQRAENKNVPKKVDFRRKI